MHQFPKLLKGKDRSIFQVRCNSVIKYDFACEHFREQQLENKPQYYELKVLWLIFLRH